MLGIREIPNRSGKLHCVKGRNLCFVVLALSPLFANIQKEKMNKKMQHKNNLQHISSALGSRRGSADSALSKHCGRFMGLPSPPSG